jgi:2-keto-4-pentenoate hydratase
MTTATENIATLFISAHREGRQFPAPADAAPATAQEAYLIQDRVFAALHPGVRASAWKVGAPRPGVEPTAAPIPPACVFPGPARVSVAGFHMIGVEIEVAFRLGRDLAGEITRDAAAAAIAEALVTIELCDTRLVDGKQAAPLWKLADCQLNAALIPGSGTRDWRAIDFSGQRAELRIDAQPVAEVVGAHPLGNPLALLPWLAKHCASRTGGLRAGDVITTGAWTGMHIVTTGTEVVARFPGIGEARVTLLR